MWGVCTLTPKTIIHSIHLYRTPAEWIFDYDRFKHQDPIYPMLIAHPGKALSFNADEAFVHPAQKDLFEVVRRYHHENLLIVMAPQPGSEFSQWISLYRYRPDQRFTPDECRTAEALLNHAMEALNTALILDAHASAGSHYAHAKGYADRKGLLYHADPAFLALLAEEAPQWSGPMLPAALRQSLSQDTQTRRHGQKIVVRIERARDSVFLSARKRVPADQLSPRQIEIARQVADGETYKEIARHLGIAPATARNHIAAIYARLGITNKAELISQLTLAD